MLLQLLGVPSAAGGIARHAFARRSGSAIINRGICAIALGAVLITAGTMRAEDEGVVRFTEADYAAYTTLRLANALAEQKQMFAHGNKAKQDAINAEFAAACAGAGWTKDRFGAIDEAV